MSTGVTIPGSPAEHRDLIYWMERVLKELENVRAAPDADAVHDLRVAIRRCRSVAAVIEQVDPDPAWPEMRRLGKKLFRQLGELRDTQVLEDWAKKLAEETDPVRQQLLSMLEAREDELRQATQRVEAKFDQKAWRRLERSLRRRARMVTPDGPVAESLALERLEATRELHTKALRTERPRPWHELRIGVKRFRYTVEGLLPARYQLWSEDLKRVQDLLGDVHDLDVLSMKVAKVASEEPQDLRDAWAEKIQAQREQRIETYRQLTLGRTSLWLLWRQGLPHGATLEAADAARLRVIARALDANALRTSQVSRLAVRLHDGLVRAHAAPVFQATELRKLLGAAARLHGIGSGLDRKNPQKAARKYLRKMSVPGGWTDVEWNLLGLIVRYHRGALPTEKQKAYGKLAEEEQTIVRALAGVIRLARALRKCGVATEVGLRLEKSADAWLVHIPGLEDSEPAAARLAAGKYLLESCLDRPLILKLALLLPRVVELPRQSEFPQASAAASD